MSSTELNFSTILHSCLCLPNSSSTSNEQPLSSTLPPHDTAPFMSQPSSIDPPPTLQRLTQPHASPSLQTVLTTLQEQMRSISVRFDRLEQSSTSRSPAIQSVPIHIGSCSSSAHSIHQDYLPNPLSESLRRAEAEIRRLHFELAARPTINNNNISSSHPIQQSPVPASILSPQFSSSYPMPCEPLHSSITSQPFSSSPSSAFQPITKLISPSLPIVTSSVTGDFNALSSPIIISNSASIPPVLPPNVISAPPIVSTPAPITFHSSDAISPFIKPSIPTLLTPLPNSTPSSNFTMTLNNNLPTFKGLAHERPIQFLTDFEIRASALVGNNDALLLQTVQQVLSDSALTWLGQLQRTPDRITTWSEFKTRFYERYHTPTKIQNLRTELRLLFQNDKESTLDYFERLKTLMVEIDPQCSDNWLKHKFIQKLRSDIRSRLDIDINLSVRDIVRKAQNIESNIEQQQVDEKLKLAANQEKKNIPNVVTNNLSMNTPIRRPLSPSPAISSSPPHYNNDNERSSSNTPHINSSNYRNNYNNNNHNNNINNTTHNNSNQNNNNRRNNSNHSFRSDNYNTRRQPGNNDRRSTNQSTRWWCPHCQRHGHSWERCPHNPDGINYRRYPPPNDSSSSTPRPPQSSNYSSPPASSTSPSSHRNNYPSENGSGR